MIKAIVISLMLVILILAGCNNEDTLIEEQKYQLNKLEEKVVDLEDTIKKQQLLLDEHDKEFSFLNDLTEEEINLYKLFIQNKDTQHLKGFPPEKIVLIYFHSVVIDDVEAIYLITYDDGTLKDLSTFRERYYREGLHKHDLETALDYRDYNSIKVNEENKSENEAIVEMSVIYGLYQSTIALGLKTQNEIWKMDLIHLMEYFKEKNNT